VAFVAQTPTVLATPVIMSVNASVDINTTSPPDNVKVSSFLPAAILKFQN